MRFGLVALALTLASPAAHAQDDVWGVGARLGTHVVPGQYPIGLPAAVMDDTFKGEPVIDKVREDVVLGIDAVYYATPFWRVGALAGFDLGKGMLDMHVIAHYDTVLVAEDIDVLAGVGLGFGRTKFFGQKDAVLNIPYYPLRAHVSALLPRDPMAYQATLFTQYNLPSNHYYTDAQGVEQDVGTGFYLTFGLELTVYWGEFRQ